MVAKKKTVAAKNVPEGPRFTRKLPVKLSPNEVAARASRAVEALTEIGEKKKELLTETAPIRDSIKALVAEVELCRKQAHERQEERDVPCVENKDYTAGEVWIIRIDTREEVPETRRTMTADERQEVFPNVKGGGRKKTPLPNAEEDEGAGANGVEAQ
jgi:hypothetical protein